MENIIILYYRIIETEKNVLNSNLISKTLGSTSKRTLPFKKPPPHFHLPSYRFLDEDNRPIRCSMKHFNNTITNKFGTPCMMCDLPKKDVEFKEIDAIYENMKIKNSQRQRSQNSLGRDLWEANVLQ